MTNRNQRSVSFSDVVQYAIGGGWGADTANEERTRVRVIRGADFPDVEMGDYSKCPVRYEEAPKAQSRLLQDGDLILEVSGGTRDRPTGRTVFVQEGQLSEEAYIPASFCRLVRIDTRVAVPRYIYYVLQNLYKRGGTWEYQNQSTGISNFQFEIFKAKFRFDLPAIEEQARVAEVLGALDDKIAANRRLASISDSLARGCFAQAVSSSAHEENLEFRFEDLAEIGGGGTPKTSVSEYWDGSIAWATPTDITPLEFPTLSETARYITEEGLANSSAKFYPAGSILMTSRATIGAFAISELPVAVNQGFIVVNAKNPKLQWWLFHEMRSRVDEFVANANGATFLELPRGRFKALTVRLPKEDLIAEFSEKAEALHRVASKAVNESRTLAAIRDALLPRLMSGELRVREAEDVVSQAV